MKILLTLCLLLCWGSHAATFDITAYGAKGDGTTLNTKAIQAAIDAAEQAGGGTILVPNGRFLTGTIVLKSNTTLHIEQGGTILGSPNTVAEYDDDGKHLPTFQRPSFTVQHRINAAHAAF
jgi:polygalacturonase